MRNMRNIKDIAALEKIWPVADPARRMTLNGKMRCRVLHFHFGIGKAFGVH